MDPSRPGHLRSDRAGLHGRGNDPLLLRSRPTSASLHRRDHFNLRLRHRSSPRITPMTCHNDSAPQGGPYRVLTQQTRPEMNRPKMQKAAAAMPRRLFRFERGSRIAWVLNREEVSVLGRPGSDLLFQVLRLSTIGAGKFDGRVRDGIGYRLPANTTRPAKDG